MPNHPTNRVLSRMGARELSEEEASVVKGSGSRETLTVCSLLPNGTTDGDTGECQ